MVDLAVLRFRSVRLALLALRSAFLLAFRLLASALLLGAIPALQPVVPPPRCWTLVRAHVDLRPLQRRWTLVRVHARPRLAKLE